MFQTTSGVGVFDLRTKLSKQTREVDSAAVGSSFKKDTCSVCCKR